MENKKIGEQIRYYRKLVGLSQSELAKKAGMSMMSIRRYETGERLPTVDSLSKIVEALGISELNGSDMGISMGSFDLDYNKNSSQNEKKLLVNGDEELTEYLELLKNSPEHRLMFSLTKDATKADVEKAVKIIETLLGKDNGE